MLKFFTAFLFFTLSLSALACFKVSGTMAVDGETFEFNQKFDHNKDYSIPLGVWILNLKVTEGKEKKHAVSYDLQEKKNNKLVLITKGKALVVEEKVKDIYAKGDPGRPHSIITIKISHI